MHIKSLFITVSFFTAATILYSENTTSRIEFTAEKGYSDGPLHTNINWLAPDRDVWTVDASSGMLTVTNKNKWARAIYKMPNLNLNSNDYTCTQTFSISFKKGSSAVVTNGALPLGIIAFCNKDKNPEFMGACIRQIKPNRFNFCILAKLNGKNEHRFSHSFDGARLGLSIDEGGNWLDTETDQLRFDFSLKYTGDKWVGVLSLKNNTTGSNIETITQVLKDDDGSFVKSDQALMLGSSNLRGNDIAFKIDAIELRN